MSQAQNDWRKYIGKQWFRWEDRTDGSWVNTESDVVKASELEKFLKTLSVKPRNKIELFDILDAIVAKRYMSTN